MVMMMIQSTTTIKLWKQLKKNNNNKCLITFENNKQDSFFNFWQFCCHCSVFLINIIIVLCIFENNWKINILVVDLFEKHIFTGLLSQKLLFNLTINKYICYSDVYFNLKIILNSFEKSFELFFVIWSLWWQLFSFEFVDFHSIDCYMQRKLIIMMMMTGMHNSNNTITTIIIIIQI